MTLVHEAQRVFATQTRAGCFLNSQSTHGERTTTLYMNNASITENILLRTLALRFVHTTLHLECSLDEREFRQ